MTSALPHFQSTVAASEMGEPQTVDIETSQEGVQTDAAALLASLVHQLEFYFSPANLAHDAYLISHMDSSRYVPIDLICNFRRVAALTNDRTLVVEALRQCRTVQLDEEETKVKPSVKLERTTLILRDIPATVSVESIQSIFSPADCPAKPLSVRSDIDDTWFVTMDTEAHCTDVALWLTSQTFNDQPIKCRVKSETLMRGFYTSAYSPDASYGYQQSAASDYNGSGFRSAHAAVQANAEAGQRKPFNNQSTYPMSLIDSKRGKKKRGKKPYGEGYDAAGELIEHIAPAAMVAPVSIASPSSFPTLVSNASAAVPSLSMPAPALNYASRVGSMPATEVARIAAAAKAKKAPVASKPERVVEEVVETAATTEVPAESKATMWAKRDASAPSWRERHRGKGIQAPAQKFQSFHTNKNTQQSPASCTSTETTSTSSPSSPASTGSATVAKAPSFADLFKRQAANKAATATASS